jgi:hypothetical protein
MVGWNEVTVPDDSCKMEKSKKSAGEISVIY